MSKIIIGKGKCKHPLGRGKPSREFIINGAGYYFCYGWTNDWGEDISPYCKDCQAHINAANDVLHKLIKEREKNASKI